MAKKHMSKKEFKLLCKHLLSNMKAELEGKEDQIRRAKGLGMTLKIYDTKKELNKARKKAMKKMGTPTEIGHINQVTGEKDVIRPAELHEALQQFLRNLGEIEPSTAENPAHDQTTMH